MHDCFPHHIFFVSINDSFLQICVKLFASFHIARSTFAYKSAMKKTLLCFYLYRLFLNVEVSRTNTDQSGHRRLAECMYKEMLRSSVPDPLFKIIILMFGHWNKWFLEVGWAMNFSSPSCITTSTLSNQSAYSSSLLIG